MQSIIKTNVHAHTIVTVDSYKDCCRACIDSFRLTSITPTVEVSLASSYPKLLVLASLKSQPASSTWYGLLAHLCLHTRRCTHIPLCVHEKFRIECCVDISILYCTYYYTIWVVSFTIAFHTTLKQISSIPVPIYQIYCFLSTAIHLIIHALTDGHVGTSACFSIRHITSL